MQHHPEHLIYLLHCCNIHLFTHLTLVISEKNDVFSGLAQRSKESNELKEHLHSTALALLTTSKSDKESNDQSQ